VEFVQRIKTGCDDSLDEMARCYTFANVDDDMACTRQVEEGAQDGRFARCGQAVNVDQGWGWEIGLLLR
jgi:hypothetical protein